MSNQAYPLQWPVGRPRWQHYRVPSQFKMSDSQMKEHLFDELDRMNATKIVVSTNRAPYSRSKAQPEDPGVAVYFTRKSQELCIACDKYLRVEDNLHAIGLAIQSFRSLERHGTGQMVDAAFRGFTALPASIQLGDSAPRAWHEVLQVSQSADAEVIRGAYRRLAAKFHPDNFETGDADRFAEIQQAYEQSGAAS